MTTPERLTGALRDQTMRWIADDPHPGDRAELQQILADAMGGKASALNELAARMSAPLSFGTAGLRGPLRAGPNGMNLAVVRRAAAGIAAHLRANGSPGATVVVGHDARHRSDEFAADAAKVLAAAGFRVLLAPGPLPTPVTAFAVRRLNAAAGLQVTASHNPPNDNGLKVYLQAGAQLVAPTDAAIEASIAAARPAISIDTDGKPEPWPADLLDAYLDAAAAVAPARAIAAGPVDGAPADQASANPGPAQEVAVTIAATAMHGVGSQVLTDALARAGFTEVHQVAAQQEPDPDFPTVSFPNPEEPGATDQLLALAQSVNADLAIANDPDADRCAIGARQPDGSWRMLRGDETGCLLGDFRLATLDRAQHPDPLVATTIVSSALLRQIAAARGARFDQTLTGFKWIVRAGDGAGTGLVYGYEEALGVCCDPDRVRDKDGISAAVLAASLVRSLKAEGRTLFDALDDLARAHGLQVTDQLSVRVTDLREISDAMARLRANPPSSLLGEPVIEHQDLLPQTDAVILRTETARVVVRPSGTEPKLKCYLEFRDTDTEDLAAARVRAGEQLAALRQEISGILGLGSP